MYGYEPERVNVKNEAERREVEEFLKSFDLNLDNDVDYTIVIRKDNQIIATCSKAKNVLKCFAVSEELRGEGITSTLISHLIDKLFEEGIYHSFIFTKPSKAHIFQALNFKLIHEANDVALLENGIYDINKALDTMAKKYNIGDGAKAALVMNCNPFTLGHQYVIEEAAKRSSEVLVFIVEENRSLFPFNVRYDLVTKGVAHLKNVKVIPGGEYIISSATFPSYFLREEGSKLKAYTELDASVFGKYFCKRFNITKRFVGEEPYCKVTNEYNNALKKVLPQYGVELCEIQRKQYKADAISASSVRELIKRDKLEAVKDIVPKVTWEFLNTSLGKEIVEKIKISNTPH